MRNALPILLVITLSGCGSLFTKEKPIEVVSKPIERAPLNLREPKLEGLTVPKWVIITPQNQTEVWTKLEEQSSKTALFGLTEEGYEDLSFLMNTLRNHIQTQKTIIQKYKEYYEAPAESKK
jgi:uncharacterized protein YceK